jgi:septum formation topological specificity factor MinE
MRTNYVLIDYENVQPDSLDALNSDQFKVLVFVGASQAKVRFDVASALQRMRERAEYIRISGNGSNALDFHIAFHIGELSARDPHGYFHIVSKDTGFDPLIQHLKERKIFAGRVKDVADIHLVKTSNAKTADDKLEVILADLKRRGASRPRAVKTLTSTIAAIFGKKLSSDDVAELVQLLQAKGWITIADTKVSYALPG